MRFNKKLIIIKKIQKIFKNHKSHYNQAKPLLINNLKWMMTHKKFVNTKYKMVLTLN